MRKLATLVLMGMLLAVASPAGAAKPSSGHQVTWHVDGGIVTFDSATEMVAVDISSSMLVQCFGAAAWASVTIEGTAPADLVELDRHGKAGSFSLQSDEVTVSIVSPCSEESSDLGNLSGTFETAKGKADSRERVGSDRIITRSGTGVLSVGSMTMEEANVQVVTTISR